HASVRLVRRWEALNHRHTPKVSNADFVLSPIRGVDPVLTGMYSSPVIPGTPGMALTSLVRLEIDDVENPGRKVGREKIAILLVDREIVEALPLWAGQIDRRHFFQALGWRAGQP